MADTSITYNVFAKFHGDETRMRKFGAAAAVVGVAVGALAVKFGRDSVSAYVDAQASQDKLQFALAKFPALADTNIDRLGKLNTALAQKTKFDDDATASGQAVLAQFVGSGKQLETLTPLLQDFAAKTGKDLPTAAASMGKAFLGNTRALKELGINYKMTGDKTQDMANITDLMREKVGGFAEKEGKTAAGQAEILRNQFGELEEGLGSKLVPVLMQLATALLAVIGFIQHNATTVKIATVAVLAMAAGLGVLVAISKVQMLILAMQTEGTLAFSVAQKASAIWTKVVTVAQWAWNAALAANPIGLVVIAIALLVAGIILAYKHSQTFRDIVHGAFHAVAAAGEFMWNVLKGAFNFLVNAWLTVAGAILHGAETAFGWIPGIGGKLHDAADKFDVFSANVRAAINGIPKDVSVATHITGGQSAINEIAALRWQLDHIPQSVTVGVISKVSKIPMNASGTRNFSGGLSIVGENGPELVSLPAGSDIYSNAASKQMMSSPSAIGMGGGPIVVSIQVDSREIARAIARPVRDELDNMTQRRGGDTLAPKR